jgi:hypothetical protein
LSDDVYGSNSTAADPIGAGAAAKIRSAKFAPLRSILSNMTIAVREDRLHLARENDQGGQSMRRVEPREMLGTENSRFSGNRRIARTMNALLAIRSNTQFSDRLKTLYNPDQVLLAWRFRPFTQPCERRPALVVASRKQPFQPGKLSGSNPSVRFFCARFRARARAARPIFSKVTDAGSKMLRWRK